MITALDLLITFLALGIYYLNFLVFSPKIHSKNIIINSLSSKKVYPSIYLPFGFLQSLAQPFRKVKIICNSTKSIIILHTELNVEIAIDIYEVDHKIDCIDKCTHKLKKSNPDNPMENIILVHGLNGSSNSSYVKGMANVFLKRTCRVFCINARGSLWPPKSNNFSHIGLTSDLKFTIEYILKNYSGDVSLIGFSLGSNWVAKLFGEYSHPRIKLGVSICCPFDFEKLNLYFTKSILRTPIHYFISNNYKKYLRKSMLNPINFDDCRYIEQIDTKLCNILKTDNLTNFYKENSCQTYMHNIDKPFLFINAIDDPIIPTQIIPIKECIKNINTGIIFIKGGHLGFFTNNKETTAELLVGEFYDKVCADGKH